ncbi:RNA-directed DNA polymerase, eukaryota, reverse transcriptase zinc-binding domain protein [Tanacetum coccineum]
MKMKWTMMGRNNAMACVGDGNRLAITNFSNIQQSPRGCRIIVGLNANDVNVMHVHSSPQSMLCLVETVDEKNKFFCCFVYAANFRKDRKELWKCLARYKSIVNSNPWVLSGDWNVSLNVADHSAGSSCKSADMLDFQESIKENGIEDLNSSGIHFTWV